MSKGTALLSRVITHSAGPLPMLASKATMETADLSSNPFTAAVAVPAAINSNDSMKTTFTLATNSPPRSVTVYLFQSLLLTSSDYMDTPLFSLLEDAPHYEKIDDLAANRKNRTLVQHYQSPMLSSSSRINEDTAEFSTVEKIIFSAALVIMIAIGLLGNGLTISAVLQRRFRLRTPANYFVLNLAVADFAISVISNTTHLINIWADFLEYELISCRILATLCLLACSESLFTLTAIAVFRFCGVRSTLQGIKRRRRLASTLIGITWVVSITFSVGNVVIEDDSLWSPATMSCLYKFREPGMAILALVLIIACLLLITGTYLSLVVRLVNNENEQRRCFNSFEITIPDSSPEVILRKNGRSLSSFGQQQTDVFLQNNGGSMINAGSGPINTSQKRRLLSLVSTSSFPLVSCQRSMCLASSYNRFNLSKTVKTVLFLVILIYVFWMPTLVVQILSRNQVIVPRQISMTALLLSHANSSVNFVVYAVFNQFFRRAVVEFICTSIPSCARFFQRQNSRSQAAFLARRPEIIDSPPRFLPGQSPKFTTNNQQRRLSLQTYRQNRQQACPQIVAAADLNNNCDSPLPQLNQSNRRGSAAYYYPVHGTPRRS